MVFCFMVLECIACDDETTCVFMSYVCTKYMTIYFHIDLQAITFI